jgi:hypothetical protein
MINLTTDDYKFKTHAYRIKNKKKKKNTKRTKEQ